MHGLGSSKTAQTGNVCLEMHVFWRQITPDVAKLSATCLRNQAFWNALTLGITKLKLIYTSSAPSQSTKSGRHYPLFTTESELTSIVRLQDQILPLNALVSVFAVAPPAAPHKAKQSGTPHPWVAERPFATAANDCFPPFYIVLGGARISNWTR